MEDNKIKEVDQLTFSSWRILKNVIVISLAFMLQFTAFSGAANLQSSINAEGGLGTASLAAIYAGLITSNVFLPAIVIRWLGTKWAMSLSFITYMPYIAAQLHPTFWTLIPTGILVGFGGGPLWCSKCTYLSMVSECYSKISKTSASTLLIQFLAIFFMIFQLNQVWGNLISSLVLTSGDSKEALTALNDSMILEICGANFLPSADAGEALVPQPPEKIQLMIGIYLACMVAASLLVAVGVDSMKSYESQRPSTAVLSGTELLAVTTKLLMKPKQLLMVVITVFIGFQQAFFGADFTASFVSCAIGTGTVGFIMTTYGIADVFGSIVTGYLAKITGRNPLLIVAFLSHLALFLTILFWKPQPSQSYVSFIIAVVWGLCDSLWMVQLNAYCGTLFVGKEEAAFANFRLWESVGFIIAYLISPYLRTSVKTYILLSTMVVGMVGYLIVDYQETKESKRLRKSEIEINGIKGCDNIAFSYKE